MRSHRGPDGNNKRPGAGGKAPVAGATAAPERLVAEEAVRFGIAVPPGTMDALLAYFEMLLRWGARINLTAARSLAALAADHLPDALALAARFDLRAGIDPGFGRRCVDAGAGGGLPGIPLALLRPAMSLVLVEATAKKAAFLRTAVRELGIETRVQVENRRLATASETGGFDGAISRAMLPPEEWLPLGRALVRPGGVVFCLSARRLRVEAAGLELVSEDSYRSDRWLAELRRST
jgi:16S rRNA (guanine527-N7)-methyltransferase